MVREARGSSNEGDSIFSETAFVGVDAMVAALLTASALALGAFVHMTFVVDLQQPGVALVQLATVVSGAALALLLVVVRRLLRQATTLRPDMAQVI